MTRRDGFTLISVMIAMVLLTVGLLALSRTLGAVVSTQQNAASRTAALEIGRSFMEQVRATPPDELASEADVKVNGQGEEDAAGVYVRAMTVSPEAANLLRVTVTVDFPRASEPVELVTYIYKGA